MLLPRGLLSQTASVSTTSSSCSSQQASTKPASRLDTLNVAGASAQAAARTSAASADQISFWAARRAELDAIPIVPKLLGFSGETLGWCACDVARHGV